KIIAIGNSLGFYSNQYASGLLQEFNPEFNLSGMAVASSEKMAGVFKADFNSPDKFAGGPIVDYAGGVIGLVGSVEQNNQEISFQIPSNKIKKVIERAIQKDFTANPKLGIYYLPLDQSQKISRGLSVSEGALIFSPSGQQGLAIIAGSPAQKAGLKINDIIIAINGEAVTLQKSLPDILYQYRSGNEIELTILRDGQEIKQKVQL
ncbi:MAG: S1C family serine protease, partial [Candidatus Moranbacteria bacterium]|nr:S1C family serine protease [Candidatus Moranbacteria bacterium]